MIPGRIDGCLNRRILRGYTNHPARDGPHRDGHAVIRGITIVATRHDQLAGQRACWDLRRDLAGTPCDDHQLLTGDGNGA